MKLHRRSVFASLAALVGLTVTASFAPAQAMDPESAQMEDDCMWRAVAQNGTLVIFADGSEPNRLHWLGGTHCTPMREDPALRALAQTAVTQGLLQPCEQDTRGRDIVWEVTLKGRLHACEKALEDPAQAAAFRQLARRWGWAQTPQPVNARTARLILSQADSAGASFGTREPYMHTEYAGALQAGLAYPAFVADGPTGAYMTLKPTPAARDFRYKPTGANAARLIRIKDTVWGMTPVAAVGA